MTRIFIRTFPIVFLTLAACSGTDAPLDGQQSTETAKSTQGSSSTGMPIELQVNPGLCVDIKGSNTDDGTPVQIYTCNGTDAQAWTFSNGTLNAFDGSVCLAVKGTDQAAGTRLVIDSCDATQTNQQWTQSGEQILLGTTGMCLDLPSGNQTKRTQLQIWPCGAQNDHQQWSFVVSTTAPTAPTSPTAPTLGSSAFTFGDILDYDGAGPHGKQTAQSFEADTKVTPSVVDSYVRVTSSGFETATAQALITQAVSGKIAAVSFSVTSEVQGKLSDTALAQLVSAVTSGTSKGLQVQVRFGYEMNGYWSPSNTTNGKAYDATNFKAQWAQVAPAVHAAGGVMFWSPNIPFNDQSALLNWLPDNAATTVDMMGIDFYPKNDNLTTANLTQALETINAIAQQYNKPIYFGETGAGNSGSAISENSSEAQTKVQWLNVLVDSGVRAKFPLYSGFRWFDYQKFENNVWNNFSISADSTAAAAFASWYKTSMP